MNVLVCGGAGYIGSNMTALLAAQGHEPVVYDNFSKGHRSAVRGVPVVAGDLADFQGLVRILREYKIEAVMHFAASIEVGESVQQPLRYYRNNLSNTQNLLSAMEAAGVQQFVFSSTAAVYGMPEKVPITENAPTKPINPYGETKLAVERMCRYQADTGRLQCGSRTVGAVGSTGATSSRVRAMRPQEASGSARRSTSVVMPVFS